ncbi:MAG: glycosyltransferase family 4 protein [Halothiobacillaceae bacterium]
MSQLHVCFLCNEYPPGPHGGVGSFTQTLGRALSARGHRVTVIGVYRVDRISETEDRGVRVIRIPHTGIRGMGFMLNGIRLRQALWRVHRQTPIDILDSPELGLASIPVDFPATKVIRMHGGHHFFSVTLGSRPRPWRSWLERRSFARANALCGVSRYVAETTRTLLRLGKRPIEILPNPIDTNMFSPRPDVEPEAGLIVFVGTVCEKKGVRQLIQAMPQIVDAVPQARLWVIGRDWSDPKTKRSFMQYLRELIPPELESHIVFRGPIERARLPDILAKAAVCVYPSHMEALPVAWLEGMAMGKPVVASRTGPGPEVIDDGVSGLLCDPYSPESIAERVIQTLKEPPLSRQLGQQARKRALEQFSIEVLTPRNEDFYQRSISRIHAR